jgi:hypothetical protein
MAKRIATVEQFYAAVDLLASALRAEGCEADARQLQQLLHEKAWTSSSELLGELKIVLKSMKRRHSGTLRAEVATCLDFAVHHRRILGLK